MGIVVDFFINILSNALSTHVTPFIMSIINVQLRLSFETRWQVRMTVGVKLLCLLLTSLAGRSSYNIPNQAV